MHRRPRAWSSMLMGNLDFGQPGGAAVPRVPLMDGAKMQCDGGMARFQGISGAERRRRRSEDQERARRWQRCLRWAQSLPRWRGRNQRLPIRQAVLQQ
jgi:hypothetical protein